MGSVHRHVSRVIPGVVLAVAGLTLVASQARAADRPVVTAVFGDSFASGEGLPAVDLGEAECQRALGRTAGNGQPSKAWGITVLDAMGLGQETRWFAACTGAKAEHFTTRQDTRLLGFGVNRDKSQYDEAVAGTGAMKFDVLLASFGGNDLGFDGVIMDCIGLDDILVGAARGAAGGWAGIVRGAVGGALTGRCRQGLDAELRAKIDNEVIPKLITLYNQLYGATTAGALIVVAGYPQPLEDPTTSWKTVNALTGRCHGVRDDDAVMLRGVAARLNQAIGAEVRAAASRQPDRTWVFADVSVPFAGHGLCSDVEAEWLNGLTTGLFGGDLRYQRSFHPTQEGHTNGYAKFISGNRMVKEWRPGDSSEAAPSDPLVQPTPGAVQAAASTTTMLVDVSGSMSEPLPGGGMKIEAARRAAIDLVSIVESEAGAGTAHALGLTTFSSVAQEVLRPTTDVASLRAAIQPLAPDQGTNMGVGLDIALGQLERSGGKTLVLLSDGLTNEGLSVDEILATTVPRAKAAGISIYAVGFGDSTSIDEPLLRRLADETGGAYGLAGTSMALKAAFIKARYQSLGDIVTSKSGTISQGEKQDLGRFPVPPGRAELHVALAWPGSDLETDLVDPDGVRVDAQYPNAQLFRDRNPEVLIIGQPKEGDWDMSVQGLDVSEAREEFFAVASVRGTATTTTTQPVLEALPAPAVAEHEAEKESSLGPFLLIGSGFTLTGGGGAGALLTRRRRPGSSIQGSRELGSRPALRLRVIEGPDLGITFAVNAGSVIGRGEVADHVLRDPTVSRTHARVIIVDGAWAVVDLGSTAGSSRNGQPIAQARVSWGDVIQLGGTVLRVEAD